MHTKSDTTAQEMTETLSFGTWLRQRRRELDLTQHAFAKQVGCARITLSRIEAGTLKPSRELASILLEQVAVPRNELEQWIRFARGQSGLPSKEQFVPATAIKPQTNLSSSLTSFIGREQEQADLTRLIGQYRLVTLTGSGGTGKTRLSLQVALEQVNNFKAGVWLVELAPLSDASLIVATIASVFNLREMQGVTLLNTLMDYLRAKELLLLLDNCEHIIEASAQIANQLLHACPYLKIIASSREALGIDGEAVYRVPSLKEAEALRLFVERATRIEPRFHLTDENAAFVNQICSRLDGIPLALELAAARVKLFTPQQIAERLNDRFKLLASDSRTALPRQQTLRALIDWSYQTLNETEQRTLRRLSVFSGGWTFEVAEAVVGEAEALDGLAGLVNKSLVNVEDHDGTSRYFFLETIRQYALEKLAESEEAVQTRDKHFDYFAKFAHHVTDKMLEERRKKWISLLNVENDNLRSALTWGTDHHLLATAYLLTSMGNFWLGRGSLTEGQAWCVALIKRLEDHHPEDQAEADLVKVRVHFVAGALANNQGRHTLARSHIEKALPLFRKLGETKMLARSLVVLSTASAFSGDIEKGFESARESIDVARAAELKFELAWGLETLSMLTFQVHGASASDEIEAYMQESLALLEELDHPWKRSRSNDYLSKRAFARGDFDAARKYAYEVLADFQESGATLMATNYKSEVAHRLRQIGRIDEALQMYCETIVAYQDFGHRGAIAHQLECFAYLAVIREQGERAVKLFGAAEALREISNSLMTPRERDEYDKQVARLRARIDGAIFAQLWVEGRAMMAEEAIIFAVDDRSE